ncbi:MAG: DUF3037 domain-containing protein [Acidobacteriaceae bacterium]|nr:DUF3037 domain-containing protein [Acidobacteriaceae bacterium]
MSDRVQCEFYLIRYVPDVVKGEFVNIGVVLREAATDAAAASPIVRFTRDWSRVRCLDESADIALMEALEAEIAERLRAAATEPKPLLPLLEDSLSNSLQITPAQASLVENMEAGVEQLMRMYVEPMKLRTERRLTGRAALVAAMRSEFEQAGVWALMRKRIAASLYTHPGDPMKIDCGYRTGFEGSEAKNMVRMFHAVSLEGEVEAAKGLAFSAPQLRRGVERVERAQLELTAIVEQPRSAPEADEEATERYRFGVETMQQHEIRVVTLNDLARVAASARVELRV